MFASKTFRVVLLPLVLSLGVVLGLGSFLETNDDQHFALLFRGVTAAAPVPTLPMYFHGLGHFLSQLYSSWPGVPWLGLLLAALLALATVLAFAVLDKLLRPHLRPPALVLALCVFFLLAWLEHWLWFSHMRVALLLAGTALLVAAQRPGRAKVLALSLGLLLLAWAIRPSAAVLAVLAAAPAAWLLAGSWARLRPVLLGAVAVLGLASLGLALMQSPDAARFRAIDRSLAAVVDYDLRRPQPQSRADSLLVDAVSLWMLGDRTLVTEAASRRAYRLDVSYFLTQVLPAKLGGRLGLLVRDYFGVLLALLATAWWAWQRTRQPLVLGLQLAMAGLLLALAAVLKLPPRLALPLLDFWLLANLAACLTGASGALADVAVTPSRRRRQLAVAFAALLCTAYAAKSWHRRDILQQERGRHERALAEIARPGKAVRVMAGADDLLKSLSPFQSYALGAGPVLWLTGWPSYDPAQKPLYQQLSGQPDQVNCLRVLSRRPTGEVQWILSANCARWLQRRLWRPAADASSYPKPDYALIQSQPLLADTALGIYNIEAQKRVYNP